MSIHAPIVYTFVEAHSRPRACIPTGLSCTGKQGVAVIVPLFCSAFGVPDIARIGNLEYEARPRGRGRRGLETST